MCVVGDNCSVIHDHKRPVNVYSYNTKDGHRSAKTADAAVGYQDLQNGEKFNLMMNQTICNNQLENHFLCPMQCWLNGVHISEVPKFLAESLSETTHAIELVKPFDTAQWVVQSHQTCCLSSTRLTWQEHWSPSKNTSDYVLVLWECFLHM